MMYILFIFVVFAFLYLGLESAFSSSGNPTSISADIIKSITNTKDSSDPIRRFLDSVSLFPPIALGLGAIISWSYRTAGSRLGVVDLFACEIDSLCKVGTIVDIAQRVVEPNAYAITGSGQSKNDHANLEAKEEYFPIFNNNAKDLQVLEASVVTNITAFYSYMKAFRDSRRLLQNLTEQEVDSGGDRLVKHESVILDAEKKSSTYLWRRDLFNIVYMLFLAYESARKATKDLVEYEPTALECIATVMITELKCYAFLVEYCRGNFPQDDIRAQRLDLRRCEYIAEAYRIDRLVCKHKGRRVLEIEDVWQPAFRLMGELRKQFEIALKEDLPESVLKGLRPVLPQCPHGKPDTLELGASLVHQNAAVHGGHRSA